MLDWQLVNPAAAFPDYRWRARTQRAEFRIVHAPGKLDGLCWHLQRFGLDGQGRPAGRNIVLGKEFRAWFATLEAAQAAADRWLIEWPAG